MNGCEKKKRKCILRSDGALHEREARGGGRGGSVEDAAASPQRPNTMFAQFLPAKAKLLSPSE